jgi:hypothetical protein
MRDVRYVPTRDIGGSPKLHRNVARSDAGGGAVHSDKSGHILLCKINGILIPKS